MNQFRITYLKWVNFRGDLISRTANYPFFAWIQFQRRPVFQHSTWIIFCVYRICTNCILQIQKKFGEKYIKSLNSLKACFDDRGLGQKIKLFKCSTASFYYLERKQIWKSTDIMPNSCHLQNIICAKIDPVEIRWLGLRGNANWKLKVRFEINKVIWKNLNI